MPRVLTPFQRWELEQERARREREAWFKAIRKTDVAVALSKGEIPKPCGGCGGKSR